MAYPNVRTPTTFANVEKPPPSQDKRRWQASIDIRTKVLFALSGADHKQKAFKKNMQRMLYGRSNIVSAPCAWKRGCMWANAVLGEL